ncbi:unnamed protein product [Prunus armeniaca]
MLSVIAEEGENGSAPRLERRRSSRGAVQQIRQLSGVADVGFRRQDSEAEQLQQSALATARLWRSRGHVAAVLQFQQLKAAAKH